MLSILSFLLFINIRVFSCSLSTEYAETTSQSQNTSNWETSVTFSTSFQSFSKSYQTASQDNAPFTTSVNSDENILSNSAKVSAATNTVLQPTKSIYANISDSTSYDIDTVTKMTTVLPVTANITRFSYVPHSTSKSTLSGTNIETRGFSYSLVETSTSTIDYTSTILMSSFWLQSMSAERTYLTPLSRQAIQTESTPSLTVPSQTSRTMADLTLLTSLTHEIESKNLSSTTFSKETMSLFSKSLDSQILTDSLGLSSKITLQSTSLLTDFTSLPSNFSSTTVVTEPNNSSASTFLPPPTGANVTSGYQTTVTPSLSTTGFISTSPHDSLTRTQISSSDLSSSFVITSTTALPSVAPTVVESTLSSSTSFNTPSLPFSSDISSSSTMSFFTTKVQDASPTSVSMDTTVMVSLTSSTTIVSESITVPVSSVSSIEPSTSVPVTTSIPPQTTDIQSSNQNQKEKPVDSAVVGGLVGVAVTGVIIASVTLLLWRRQAACFNARQPMGKSVKGEENIAFVEDELSDRRTKRPVSLTDFSSHFNNHTADSNLQFSLEFHELENLSPRYPTSEAELEETRLKNRYTNILPFNKTRVKLIPIEDQPGSDYINASYIVGFSSAREYIATQGPIASTINDFWRLVWEQNVSMIVMLTQCMERSREKCAKYWPEVNEALFYGDIIVKLETESHLPDYILRIFTLRTGDLVRQVRQYYYLLWPDMGTPDCTDYLLRFVQTVRGDVRPDMTGPILVHCSAGVGRTGTFIALDTLIRKIKSGYEHVDVFGQVMSLRGCRLNMVQTERQYVYLHECIRDFVNPPETENDDINEDMYENVSVQQSKF